MKNIHILPTDKPILDGSINYILKCIKEFKIYNKQYKIGDILDELSWDFDSNYWKPQNIYITSDEDIKEGDWYLYCNQINKRTRKNPLAEYPYPSYQKIILTTDQDLVKDGVQVIGNEFLEWFVKNPSCDKVTVIKNIGLADYSKSIENYKYKIIIPKEEPKFENSIENTINIISIANSMFGTKEEPKQETLEEHNYLQGFVNQFEEEGEHQELSNNDWTVSRFLEWLQSNNFKIIKNGNN